MLIYIDRKEREAVKIEKKSKKSKIYKKESKKDVGNERVYCYTVINW